jgi:fibronectin type 3 domain-containing protein
MLETAGASDLKIPARQSILRDSFPQNYVAYQYRLRGINAFGDHSAASNIVTVMGQYRVVPGQAVITGTKNFKNNLVKIDWKQSKPGPAIAGYLVGRGNSDQGPFSPIALQLLKPSTTSFIDSSASPNQENYYVVTTFDTAGNFSNSYPAHVAMVDTIAPDAPKMAVGTIDTLGRVLISWHRPMAPDVAGYMIQRANALNHDFVPVSKGFVTDTAFKDSIPLRTLTKHIYYRVIAYDRVRNGSLASNIVDISKPDIVPPVPAVFVNYKTTDTSIQLAWNKSTSVDLSKQYLYRKGATGDWVQVALLDNKQVMYNDTTVQKQVMYTYQLVSQDSAGLRSEPSFPISAKTYFKAPENGDGSITATLQADSSAIKVEWALKNNVHPASIVLYRSVNGGTLAMYENIPAAPSVYIDKRVSAGNTYSYSFKCVYAGNNESILAKEATVIVKK